MTEIAEEIDLADQEIICLTTPHDAETVLVDGIKGIAVTSSLVRMSFIENVLDTNAAPNSSESIRGRHVLNLVMDHGSFGAVLALLNRVHADMQARQDG